MTAYDIIRREMRRLLDLHALDFNKMRCACGQRPVKFSFEQSVGDWHRSHLSEVLANGFLTKIGGTKT